MLELVGEDVLVLEAFGLQCLTGGFKHLGRTAKERLAGGRSIFGQFAGDAFVNESRRAFPIGALFGFGEGVADLHVGELLRHGLEFRFVQQLIRRARTEEQPAGLLRIRGGHMAEEGTHRRHADAAANTDEFAVRRFVENEIAVGACEGDFVAFFDAMQIRGTEAVRNQTDQQFDFVVVRRNGCDGICAEDGLFLVWNHDLHVLAGAEFDLFAFGEFQMDFADVRRHHLAWADGRLELLDAQIFGLDLYFDVVADFHLAGETRAVLLLFFCKVRLFRGEKRATAFDDAGLAEAAGALAAACGRDENIVVVESVQQLAAAFHFERFAVVYLYFTSAVIAEQLVGDDEKDCQADTDGRQRDDCFQVDHISQAPPFP